MKRKPRGPKCPVCQAVMHQKNGEGPFTCSFVNSHADILRMRADAANRAAETNRGRAPTAGSSKENLAKARRARRKKGKDDG